ncbi:MAG: hypothetical protein LQ338_003865 [Usnochroma carphineum]|nr:MAG: hypothetical protein LQ338_003865 [Usnochroma carphineum]
MDRLPTEIILDICSWLASFDLRWEVNTVDLKSFRLTNSAFAGPAAEFLFSEVLVFMNPTSLGNLQAIAKHPVYKNRVHHVVVFSSLISHKLSKRDYVDNVRGMVFSGPGSKDWGFNDQGNRVLSRRAVDEGYNEYQRALKEQEEALISARSQLTEAFKAFPNLGYVESRGFHECLDDDEGAVLRQPATVYNIARKTLAPWGLVWVGKPYPAEDAKLICEAVSRSGCCLHELELGGGVPIDCELLMTSGVELEHLSKAVRCSKDVLLCLTRPEEDRESEDVFDGQYPAFGFLDDAPRLQKLVLYASGRFDFQGPLLLGTLNWPQLARLMLRGFDTTETQLRSLLRSVRSTLIELILEGVTLMEGSWYNLFQEMKPFHFERESLWLCGLDSFSLPEIRLGANHEALIRDFICDGKEWSPELPEWLL